MCHASHPAKESVSASTPAPPCCTSTPDAQHGRARATQEESKGHPLLAASNPCSLLHPNAVRPARPCSRHAGGV